MKVEIHTNEDGSPKPHPETGRVPWLNYIVEGDEVAVMTAEKVTGRVTVADGTVYDLAPHYVGVRPEHVEEVVSKHNTLLAAAD